jgi:hypothetical protein
LDKKDKGQTLAIQWTKKTKDKHRQQNGQEGKRTSTGNTMYKKDKNKHRPYNRQRRQMTNTGLTM